MTFEVLAAAFITGMAVKLVDAFEEGRGVSKSYIIMLGAFYGFLITYVMLKSQVVANIWMAAVLGNLVAGKIDSPGHRAGLFSMLFILSAFGFPKFDPMMVSIFALASYADEFFNGFGKHRKSLGFPMHGNHRFLLKIKARNKTIMALASYRIILEATALAVSFYTSQWLLFASIFVFDAGYVITNSLTGKNSKF